MKTLLSNSSGLRRRAGRASAPLAATIAATLALVSPAASEPLFGAADSGDVRVVPRADRHGDGEILPTISLDRYKVLAGAPQELYVLVRFDIAKPARVDYGRPPLNIGLVIDRSGSMADRGKITHAREAAIRLVDAMDRSDVLGVVEYDDQITVLWPSSPLESPRLVKELIAELEPRGSTNLAGGLLQGIEETRGYVRDRGIHRVILLSDGLANVGMTSPMEIAGFVRRARAHGIGVSTIGLGLEYNEDLMQTIAEAGGGNYYYVESPSQMASIFEQELSTLFTTVAKDVRLRFEARHGVRDMFALGYDVVKVDGGFEIPLEDLYGGEKRTVLLRLEVQPPHAGTMDLGALHIEYANPESRKQSGTRYDLAVDATYDARAVEASVDRPAAAEATLMTAENEHEQSVRDYERGEKELAKGNLAALRAKLAQANESLKDVRIEKKIEQLGMEGADMDEADLSEENRQMYLKSSKANLYRAQKGKRGAYLLQQQDAGPEVERLQQRLEELGLYEGPVDGQFSGEVARAVREYQSQNGLEVDGIAGPATLRSLNLY